MSLLKNVMLTLSFSVSFMSYAEDDKSQQIFETMQKAKNGDQQAQLEVAIMELHPHGPLHIPGSDGGFNQLKKLAQVRYLPAVSYMADYLAKPGSAHYSLSKAKFYYDVLRQDDIEYNEFSYANTFFHNLSYLNNLDRAYLVEQCAKAKNHSAEPAAMLLVGRCYQEGIHQEKSLLEAKAYYQQAHMLGYTIPSDLMSELLAELGVSFDGVKLHFQDVENVKAELAKKGHQLSPIEGTDLQQLAVDCCDEMVTKIVLETNEKGTINGVHQYINTESPLPREWLIEHWTQSLGGEPKKLNPDTYQWTFVNFQLFLILSEDSPRLVTKLEV